MLHLKGIDLGGGGEVWARTQALKSWLGLDPCLLPKPNTLIPFWVPTLMPLYVPKVVHL